MPDRAGLDAPVLIAEDDEGARELLTETLRRHGYATVAAACGESALEAARTIEPSLALLDVNLPLLSGYEVCRSLRELYGDALPIIFISGERIEPYDRVAGLLIGADDYLVKPFAVDELLARMRRLLRRRAATPAERGRLTPRELEVLHHLADGLTQREIAERLTISPKTVGTHIEHILAKLGVRNRAQAVARAYRDELLGASV